MLTNYIVSFEQLGPDQSLLGTLWIAEAPRRLPVDS